MSELDAAMDHHIYYLVHQEKRNFSVVDFRRFIVDGKEYRMTAGTFRNKVLKRKKLGTIELDCKSGCAFYTIKGHKFSNPMTPYHTGGIFSSSVTVGRQTPLYKWLRNLPVERQSLHNIRLRFEDEGIWQAMSQIHPTGINTTNQDIALDTWLFNNDIDILVTIHHTDTVTVTMACSYKPIATDVNGLVDCVEVLVRTEDRITAMLSKTNNYNDGNKSDVTVPSFRKWIGVMWHFGVDGIDTYDKEAFHVTFEEGVSDIYTIYTKRMKDGTLRPRIERQEYSKNPFVEIFLEKLYPAGVLR